MVDTKISQLPSATTPLSGAELVPLVQSGATVQTPTNEISKLTAATANTFTANQIISVTDNTNAALRVTQLGTADALRIEDSTNPDSTPFIVDASGNVGIGGGPVSGSKLNTVGALSSNGALGANLTSTSVMDYNAGYQRFISYGPVGTQGGYQFLAGTGGGVPVAVALIDTVGTFTIVQSGAGLGYGTGSGGTVTQLTSKSTSVTINKTNGSITTSNGALANNITVPFAVFNNTVAATDTIVLSMKSGNTQGAYLYWVDAVAAGQFNVCIRNISGGSLSEALVINFAVIKAVTS